ncbi:hypothetical protein BE04_07840 [Sorangium cellulosum]|uniref:Uncharacterized protein n=1 Tax=Sorangium cellulosum TaxID=56 RepID=A0A150P9L0_SORCE|nr:hypothetical protein BE04_07840 [Sorangium cellulosum]
MAPFLWARPEGGGPIRSPRGQHRLAERERTGELDIEALSPQLRNDPGAPDGLQSEKPRRTRLSCLDEVTSIMSGGGRPHPWAAPRRCDGGTRGVEHRVDHEAEQVAERRRGDESREFLAGRQESQQLGGPGVPWHHEVALDELGPSAVARVRRERKPQVGAHAAGVDLLARSRASI